MTTALVITALILVYFLGRRVGRIQGAVGATSWWLDRAHAESADLKRRERVADLRLKQLDPRYEEQRKAAQEGRQ